VAIAALVVLTRSHGHVTRSVGDEPGCPLSGRFPATVTPDRVDAAIVCLLNRRRAEQGLPVLREQAQLDVAAERQAADIVRRRFWSHVNPDGRSAKDRILATGYGPSLVVGENLAWGQNSEATPVEIVKRWMQSAGHRANILEPRYREIGIGVMMGAPRPGVGNAAVYATTFGAGPVSR